MPPVASFLQQWSFSREIASGFAEYLLDECPWLDGETELNSELAVELLADSFGRWKLLEEVPTFIDAYNEFVLVSSGVRHPAREQAYTAMLQVLAEYGRNDGCGEGDFWLVEATLSEEKPRVVVFDRSFKFSEAALDQLARAAAICPFFSEVVVGDNEGTVLQTKAVPQNGG
nr:hypothetical protein [uncultured Caldimonas sp.]